MKLYILCLPYCKVIFCLINVLSAAYAFRETIAMRDDSITQRDSNIAVLRNQADAVTEELKVKVDPFVQISLTTASNFICHIYTTTSTSD